MTATECEEKAEICEEMTGQSRAVFSKGEAKQRKGNAER